MRDALYLFQLDQFIGDHMQGPPGRPSRGLGASNHTDFGFDPTIKLERPTTARLIFDEIQDMVMLAPVVVLAHITDGGVADTQRLFDFFNFLACIGHQ